MVVLLKAAEEKRLVLADGPPNVNPETLRLNTDLGFDSACPCSRPS